MCTDAIYIYCVTKVVPKFNPALEKGDNGIYFLSNQGLYAVVSKVPSYEFSEEGLMKNLSNMKWVTSRVLKHEEVIEEVMKNCSVIPLKFGTIFKTEDNVKAMLEQYHKEFNDNLVNLEGKEEWAVKIYCDMEKLKNALLMKEEILAIEKEIRLSSAGKAYFLKKKKEELIKETINKTINEYGQDSFERLKEQSLQVHINKLLPKEVTGRMEDMILNAAFLIDKKRAGDFIDILESLREKYDNKGFNLDCTGPWPPYNFCHITSNEDKK